jgi:hypothetical protein
MKTEKIVFSSIVKFIIFLGLNFSSYKINAQNECFINPYSKRQISTPFLSEVYSSLLISPTKKPINLHLPSYSHQGILKHPLVLGKEFSLNAYPVFMPKFSQIQKTLSFAPPTKFKSYVLAQTNH